MKLFTRIMNIVVSIAIILYTLLLTSLNYLTTVSDTFLILSILTFVVILIVINMTNISQIYIDYYESFWEPSKDATPLPDSCKNWYDKYKGRKRRKYINTDLKHSFEINL